MIAHQMWQSDFGGDPGVVGRTLQLRGQPYTIVGVAPAGFTGLVPLLIPELWLPITHVEEVEPAGINDNVPSPTGTHATGTPRHALVLREGTDEAGRDRDAGQRQCRASSARSWPPHIRRRTAIAACRRSRRATSGCWCRRRQSALSTGSAAVMAVVGLVLLIACANVTGMLLARARRDAARSASAWRSARAARNSIRQMLTEGPRPWPGGRAVAAALAWALDSRACLDQAADPRNAGPRSSARLARPDVCHGRRARGRRVAQLADAGTEGRIATS